MIRRRPRLSGARRTGVASCISGAVVSPRRASGKGEVVRVERPLAGEAVGGREDFLRFRRGCAPIIRSLMNLRSTNGRFSHAYAR